MSFINLWFISIGWVVSCLGTLLVIATIGSYTLDSIVRFSKFGKEFYKYLAWRRNEVLSSPVLKVPPPNPTKEESR